MSVYGGYDIVEFFVAYDMRPDEGQSEYEEVQKELSSKEEELEVR